jgi:hypothetical protein
MAYFPLCNAAAGQAAATIAARVFPPRDSNRRRVFVRAPEFPLAMMKFPLYEISWPGNSLLVESRLFARRRAGVKTSWLPARDCAPQISLESSLARGT